VGAYIAQVDRVLAAAQGVFPAAGGPGSVQSQAPGVPAAPADSALSTGAGNAGDGYKRTWGAVTGLDAQTNGTSAAGAADGLNGRSNATGVRQSAASAAAAIAPATGSPAGVKTLVASMDGRLAAMQRQLDATKAQNQLLATRMRQLAMAYRQSAQASSAGMFGRIGAGIGGGAMPSMGMGGGGFPGMGMYSKLPAMLSGQNSRNAADQLTAGLFGKDGNGSDRANRAVAFAKSKLGAPYVWGATGPNAFDCSGLVQWAYGKTGVSLPRTTYDLVNAGTPVSRGNMRAGDLILCNWQRGQPEHVVMAVSPDMVIEAPNRHERVKFSSIPSGQLMIRRVA
jgi:cell wall-associated NlpC family hydrolase